MKSRKILQKISNGSRNVRFEEAAAPALGFTLSRVNGSRYVFQHSTVREAAQFAERQRAGQALSNQAVAAACGAL